MNKPPHHDKVSSIEGVTGCYMMSALSFNELIMGVSMEIKAYVGHGKISLTEILWKSS